MDWKLTLEIALFLAVGVACALALPFLRERLGAERLKSLWKWTCLCVQAAEQLFGPGTGERKKQYAQQELLRLAPGADAQTADILIEAAVRERT